MPKPPKSVTGILALVVAGIQAIAELIKVAKSEPEEKKEAKRDE